MACASQLAHASQQVWMSKRQWQCWAVRSRWLTSWQLSSSTAKRLATSAQRLATSAPEVGDLRKGLVEHTVHDIRSTASLVMARARRSAGIAKLEELHTHFSASVSKAS